MPAPAPAVFHFSAWRRPVRSQLPLLLGALAASPAVVAVAAYPLLAWARVPPRWALVGVSLLWLGLLAAVVLRDRAALPAGTLRLGDGRLRFDAGPGRPVDAPLDAVRKVLAYGQPGAAASLLVIWLRPARRVVVHGERLGGIPVETVRAAVLDALDIRTFEMVHDASARAPRAEARRRRVLFVVFVLLAVAIAAVRLWAE